MKKIYFLFLLCINVIKLNAQVYETDHISMHSNWFDTAVVAEPAYGIKYNGIWGYATGGHEYALVGSTAGVYFVDVTNPAAPVTADFVAGHRDQCIWREIKTYSHYAYLISDDASPNSFQIVDLQYLPDSVHVVADYSTLFERGHTIFIDGNKMYIGIARGGMFTSTASMAVFSLANPEIPVFLRSINNDYPSRLTYNQVHDMFVKNDTVYASCAYDGLFIFKYDSILNHFNLLSSLTTYPDQGYNHSSALTDDSQTLVFMDEVPAGKAVKVVDVSDLQNMVVTSTFKSNTGPTPHNPFIVGNTCYIAYYLDGLQVYDVSDPYLPVRIGYFDTHYQEPLGGPYPSLAYQGAWGAYPYLPSGNVLVSDMQNGLYVLDVTAMTGLSHPTAENQTVVFPNPAVAGEIIRIKSSQFKNQEVVVSVIDALGKVVSKSTTMFNEFLDLNTSKLPAGVYTLQLVSGEDHVERRVVITTL